MLAPLAVIEWKVCRGKKGGRDTSHDTEWLRAFAKANTRSVGYSVTLRFREADEHCGIRVTRFFRNEHDTWWFSA